MNSEADLDRLLHSPVGLAHRCSGGPSFRSANKFKNTDVAEELFDTWNLTVWKDSGRRVLNGPRRIATNGDNWIDALSDRGTYQGIGNDAELKFRVLLTRPPQDGEDPWPKFHDRSSRGYKQIYYLPFCRRHMKRLILEWALPRDWLYLKCNCKGFGNYAKTTIWNETTGVAEKLTYTINFPYILSPSRRFTPPDPKTWKSRYLSMNIRWTPEQQTIIEEEFRNGDHFIWSIAICHDLLSGLTDGIFDGFTERVTEDLCERLGAKSFLWSEHPLYLPIIALDMYVGCATSQTRDVDYAYHALDKAGAFDFETINRFGNNLANMVEVERMLDFCMKLANFMIDTLAYLEEDGIVPDDSHPGDVQLIAQTTPGSVVDRFSGRRKSYIKFVNRQMRESLLNTIELVKGQIHFTSELQKRNGNALGMLQANLSRVENLYSKDRADDSRSLAYDAKQDSTSMITISIMTIAFLPTTAVAAICSMSIFDWSKPHGVVVSPHFWIFWAVVIPLTLSLMTAWFAWFFLYRKPKMQHARQKMECQSCSNLRIFGSSRQCEEHRLEFSVWDYWQSSLPDLILLPRKRKKKRKSFAMEGSFSEGRIPSTSW